MSPKVSIDSINPPNVAAEATSEVVAVPIPGIALPRTAPPAAPCNAFSLPASLWAAVPAKEANDPI